MEDEVLVVAGLRASGPGYPNASQTIHALQGRGITRIVDLGEPLPDDVHLWNLRNQGTVRKFRTLAHLVWANVRSLLRVLRWAPGKRPLAYIPYPAIPFLCLVRLVPHRKRPRCIADAYISLWDARFNDRATETHPSWTATVAKVIEGWALRVAEHVLVDTEANRDFLLTSFRLQPERISSVPLAIDDKPFLAARGAVSMRAGTRVLFMGTFIPLHGVDVIIEAVGDLDDRPDIEVCFVGDGQLGPQIATLIEEKNLSRIRWVREWQTLEQIAAHVADADVCLGIFGGGGKSARVLPFKLYYAMAAGKAIISQMPMSVPKGVPDPPYLRIDGEQRRDRVRELAAAIRELADDRVHRRELEVMAAAYYDRHLSREALVDRWRKLLESA